MIADTKAVAAGLFIIVFYLVGILWINLKSAKAKPPVDPKYDPYWKTKGK
jgi:hypothetical protein